MEFVIIPLVALLASLLTFFSGFGLGTILLPAFALFFPAEVAIGLTAIVHFLNNVFKTGVIGRKASRSVVLRFGIPAIAGAMVGALLLNLISGSEALYTWQLGTRTCEITTVKLAIAGLMVIFALFEILPALKNIQLDENRLILGGTLSGFFGGLSGHQGALRSLFLLRAGLDKESFIATGIVIAMAIDLSRMSVYAFTSLPEANLGDQLPILSAAIAAAFVGAIIGRQALKKVTLNFVQNTVSVLILLIALAMGSGVI